MVALRKILSLPSSCSLVNMLMRRGCLCDDVRECADMLMCEGEDSGVTQCVFKSILQQAVDMLSFLIENTYREAKACIGISRHA